jgi:hypothetical protein
MSSNPQPFGRAARQIKGAPQTARCCVVFAAESGKTAASRLFHKFGKYRMSRA